MYLKQRNLCAKSFKKRHTRSLETSEITGLITNLNAKQSKNLFNKKQNAVAQCSVQRFKTNRLNSGIVLSFKP